MWAYINMTNQAYTLHSSMCTLCTLYHNNLFPRCTSPPTPSTTSHKAGCLKIRMFHVRLLMGGRYVHHHHRYHHHLPSSSLPSTPPIPAHIKMMKYTSRVEWQQAGRKVDMVRDMLWVCVHTIKLHKAQTKWIRAFVNQTTVMVYKCVCMYVYT